MEANLETIAAFSMIKDMAISYLNTVRPYLIEIGLLGSAASLAGLLGYAMWKDSKYRVKVKNGNLPNDSEKLANIWGLPVVDISGTPPEELPDTLQRSFRYANQRSDDIKAPFS